MPAANLVAMAISRDVEKPNNKVLTSPPKHPKINTGLLPYLSLILPHQKL